MALWSRVTVGGKSFDEILTDNKDSVGDIHLDKLLLETAKLVRKYTIENEKYIMV